LFDLLFFALYNIMMEVLMVMMMMNKHE